MKKIIFFLFFIFFSQTGFTQPGCTDSQAINYEASANSNDGSCIYPTTNYMMDLVTVLGEELQENSGLIYVENELWIHNDAGNENEIYRINKATGEIEHTILIANADNEDWEDLAQDNDFIYIGDFGNNDGNRTDLRIFRIPKINLGNLIVNADVINFEFSDQTDFSQNPNNNDYDCEAFFYHNDSLHLFSKNWVNQKTRHYTVPAQPGDHIALLRDSLNAEGLITGADIDDDGVVALIGYTPSGVNFMWLLFDYQSNHFFSGNKRKISLGTGLTNSQTEGIAFTKNGNGFVSGENFTVLPPRLLRFSTSQWTDETVSIQENIVGDFIQVYPNPFNNEIRISIVEQLSVDACLVLKDIHGNELLKSVISSGENAIVLPASFLSAGWYILKIQMDEQQNYWKMVKY